MEPMARPTRVGAATASANVVPIGAGGSAETLVESYRRLAEVFHHVLSEQSLDALLDRIADTLSDLIPYDALTSTRRTRCGHADAGACARSLDAEQIMASRPDSARGSPAGRSRAASRSTRTTPTATRARGVPGTPDETEALISVPLIARGSAQGRAQHLPARRRTQPSRAPSSSSPSGSATRPPSRSTTRTSATRLEHQAQTDSLTGLFNHRYFHERLRAELMRARRSHDSVAC